MSFCAVLAVRYSKAPGDVWPCRYRPRRLSSAASTGSWAATRRHCVSWPVTSYAGSVVRTRRYSRLHSPTSLSSSLGLRALLRCRWSSNVVTCILKVVVVLCFRPPKWLIGPILWGYGGPLCHALSLLSLSLSSTLMRRQREKAVNFDICIKSPKLIGYHSSVSLTTAKIHQLFSICRLMYAEYKTEISFQSKMMFVATCKITNCNIFTKYAWFRQNFARWCRFGLRLDLIN